MNILIISDFLYGGGAEVVFREMRDALLSFGHIVDTYWGAEKPKLMKSPIKYIYNTDTLSNLSIIFEKKIYDVVIVLNYASCLSPSVWAIIGKYKKIQNYKVLYNAHDAHLICPNSGLNYFKNDKMFRFNAYKGISSFMFKRLDHRGILFSELKKLQWLLAFRVLRSFKIIDLILVPSNFLKDRINLMYPKIEIKLLRNPCLDTVDNQQQEFEQIGDSKCINMIFIGRISQEKGILPFIEGISKINDDFLFDIYGTGPEEKKIQNLIDNLNLGAKIKLRGYHEHSEIIKIIGKYDVLILPSIMCENAPMSIVEAANHNLFILSMNYGGMKDISEAVGNDVLIDSYNPDEIKTAMNQIRHMKFHKRDLSEFSKEVYMHNLRYIIES